MSHYVLLQKLHKYGVCGAILNWFQSYLISNRSQRVQFRGAVSDWASVHSGVPQGSVLAPSLFNIFVFDLPFCVQSNLRQYAGDRVIRSQDDELTLQNDLQHIGTWCEINHMLLNSDKRKLTTITLELPLNRFIRLILKFFKMLTDTNTLV